jgi:AcrR family transcriptional regulator
MCLLCNESRLSGDYSGKSSADRKTMTSRDAALTSAAEHRSATRRHGDDLERAVHQAVLAELADVGYERTTMDRIAKRARTGKTSLYRRWPTRADLVLDALRHRPARAIRPHDTGDLREDLLTWLRRLAVLLDGPLGATVRGLVGELPESPATGRAIRERVIGLRTESLLEWLRRHAADGRIRVAALDPRLVDTGPALVLHHFLTHGPPVPDDILVDIVDEILLPLLTGRFPERP